MRLPVVIVTQLVSTFVVSTLLVVVLSFAASDRAVSAQTTDTATIAAEVDRTGQFLEPSSDSTIDAAIARANAQGIGFVWLRSDDDAELLALDILGSMEDAGSRYSTVLVLTNTGVWGQSTRLDPAAAGSAALEAFSRGAVAEGIDTFTSTLTGTTASETTPTSTGGAADASSDSASGGIGAWFWGIVAAIGAFFGIRFLANKRRTKKAEAESLELDRVEIREQLRNNADRVIDLGDKVIASGDQQLIRTYEQASRTYQDVSSEIENASTIAEVDQLDDKIDHAEWQFEVIEATLEGRPPPAAPSPDADDARDGPSSEPAANGSRASAPGQPSSGPALGPDDSVVSGVPAGSADQPRPGRRRTGLPPNGRGGGTGGGLGSILGSIILGGAANHRPSSRRTQQRRASSGGFGGLGGGVLRPGSSRTSSRPTSRGGGSFGGRSKGGGGRF